MSDAALRLLEIRAEKAEALNVDLLEALKAAVQHCAWCDGTSKDYTHEDETEVGCSPGSSEIPCPNCTGWREAIAKAETQDTADA